MTPQMQVYALAVAALLACVALCDWCRAGADASPAHSVVEVLRQRGRQRELEKALWRALASYAERDLEEGRREDFWRALAGADVRPVALSKSYTLRVGAALSHSAPFDVEYRLWLVPAPGRVLLFGYPSQFAEN